MNNRLVYDGKNPAYNWQQFSIMNKREEGATWKWYGTLLNFWKYYRLYFVDNEDAELYTIKTALNVDYSTENFSAKLKNLVPFDFDKKAPSNGYVVLLENTITTNEQIIGLTATDTWIVHVNEDDYIKYESLNEGTEVAMYVYYDNSSGTATKQTYYGLLRCYLSDKLTSSDANAYPYNEWDSTTHSFYHLSASSAGEESFVITDENLIGGISYEQTVDNSNMLPIGTIASASIQFTCLNTDNWVIKNKTFKYYVKYNESSSWTKVGEFKIITCKYDYISKRYSCIGYDNAYLLNQSASTYLENFNNTVDVYERYQIKTNYTSGKNLTVTTTGDWVGLCYWTNNDGEFEFTDSDYIKPLTDNMTTYNISKDTSGSDLLTNFKGKTLMILVKDYTSATTYKAGYIVSNVTNITGSSSSSGQGSFTFTGKTTVVELNAALLSTEGYPLVDKSFISRISDETIVNSTFTDKGISYDTNTSNYLSVYRICTNHKDALSNTVKFADLVKNICDYLSIEFKQYSSSQKGETLYFNFTDYNLTFKDILERAFQKNGEIGWFDCDNKLTYTDFYGWEECESGVQPSSKRSITITDGEYAKLTIDDINLSIKNHIDYALMHSDISNKDIIVQNYPSYAEILFHFTLKDNHWLDVSTDEKIKTQCQYFLDMYKYLGIDNFYPITLKMYDNNKGIRIYDELKINVSAGSFNAYVQSISIDSTGVTFNYKFSDGNYELGL